MQVPDAWPNQFRAVAVSVGGRFGSGRSFPAARSHRRWRACSPGRSSARTVAARRDAHHLELHGASFADTARRFRRGIQGAQRLGSRPGESAAEVLATEPRAAWMTLIGRLFDEGTVRAWGLRSSGSSPLPGSARQDSESVRLSGPGVCGGLVDAKVPDRPRWRIGHRFGLSDPEELRASRRERDRCARAVSLALGN